jgi:hypothetical protein
MQVRLDTNLALCHISLAYFHGRECPMADIIDKLRKFITVCGGMINGYTL